MPKTGKERKARRRARQAAEAALVSQQAQGGATDGGSVKASPLLGDASAEPLGPHELAHAELAEQAGEHWEAAGSPVQERANQRLVHRSLRWLTNGDGESFEGKPEAKLTHKELALLQTRAAMLAKDFKTSVGLGVRTLIALEAQNQRDELAYDPFKQPAPAGGGDAPEAPAVQVIFNLPSNGRGPG